MPQLSPCIGYCKIDETSGLCAGCARTRSEIAEWLHATPTVRDQIWSELPERREKLGIGLRQLGWTQTEIRSFVADSLQSRGGTWVIGVYGALAEFCIGANEPVDFDLGETHVAAATVRGAMRFEVTERVRALGLTMKVGCGQKELVVLTVPRAKADRKVTTGVVALGPDHAAIRESERDESLFDLGLGIGEIEFCVRTHDIELAHGLDCRIGQRWPELLSGFGHQILHASPTRVARSPVGRLEVFTPIPLPGGRSPEGPHTHLLPVNLVLERESPPGLELPQALVPCAVFYPETGPADSCE